LRSNGGWLGSNVKQGAIAKQWLCLIVQSFEGWLQSSGAIAKQGCAATRGDRKASGNCKARGNRKAMLDREARGDRKAMLDSEAARIVRSSDRSFVRSFVRPIVQRMAAFVQPKGQLQSIGCVRLCGCEARGDRETMVAFVRPIVRRMVAKQGAASKDCSFVRLFVC